MNLSGNPADFVVAFLGGLLVSFTPCVYPLIPISAGFIGIESGGSRLRGFALSFVYVTGIAVTYSILGLLASLTGVFFGTVSSNPLTMICVGALVIIFGFAMLDVVTINLPSITALRQIKKHSYISTFFLGLSSGLIVSPCLTPVLGSILFYLAAQKHIVYGAFLLFSFAYGMGLILILAGVFSALLVNMPKAGKWSEYVKKFCAFILLGTGLYFIYTGIRRF